MDAERLYKSVTALTNELKVNLGRLSATSRRKTGTKLLELLSSEKNRAKLNELAISLAIKKGHSHTKAKRLGPSRLWTPIISTAFNAAANLSGGKAKLSAEDVKLPLRLLHFSDSDNKSGDYDRMRLESTCKLGGKTVELILKFCFDMLENDEARQLAESDIMNTLALLCERVDYVAHFRLQDLIEIFSIVEACLGSHDASISAIAARIFGDLIETCVELGISLHLFMSQCVEVVAKWCRKSLERASRNPREQVHLFRGIAAVLRFHPEQAIQPMTSNGRIILRFAKRSYHTASYPSKHAIHCYLIAHMIVCQEAGKLKGLFPGDLGSLGKASLTLNELDVILPMTISSISRVDIALTARKCVTWKGLDAAHRTHLELCARLLACAQRQYLIKEEWKLHHNPNVFFAKMLDRDCKDKDDLIRGSVEDIYPSCPIPILAESPWVRLIMKPIVENMPEIGRAYLSLQPISVTNTNSQTSMRHAGDHNCHEVLHPLLNQILQSSMHLHPPDPKQLSSLLLVICACAEAFPSGKCWTSSAQRFWYSLAPDDRIREDIQQCQACSPSDFALLLIVLSAVLESSGGSAGDAELRVLSILCLIKLNEAHDALTCLADKQQLSDVAVSWRKIWSILLRSDLRYAACTAQPTIGSCGELVLILLTEMTYRICTDPGAIFSTSISLRQSTFLYRQQSQIWALPVFSKSIPCRAQTAVELACTVLSRLGLSDEGRDNIQDSSPLTVEGLSLDTESHKSIGRRHRLVCFCLDLLHSWNPKASSTLQLQRLGTVAIACLSSVVHGIPCLEKRTYQLQNSNQSWVRKPSKDFQCRFCFTDLPDSTICLPRQKSAFSPASMFAILWNDVPLPEPGVSALSKKLMETIGADVVLAEKTKLYERILTEECGRPSMDYVATTASGPLRDLVYAHMVNLKERWAASYLGTAGPEGDGTAFDDDHNVSLAVTCLWLKTVLAVFALPTGHDRLSCGLQILEESLPTIFAKMNKNLFPLCADRDSFYSVFADVLQILQFVSSSLSSLTWDKVSANLRKPLSSLQQICESLLLCYSGNEEQDGNALWDEQRSYVFSDSSSVSDSSDVASVQEFDALDDSDDDEIVNLRTKKKKETTIKARSKKRKTKHQVSASTSHHSSSPRKKRKRHPTPPDSACACLVGSILMTLEPSVSRSEFVVKKLMRDQGENEVNLAEAFHCLSLLADESVIYHDNAMRHLMGSGRVIDESFRHESPFSLIYDTMIALRENAPPSSILNLYGFGVAAKCVEMGENDLRGLPLTAEEAKNLLSLLTDEEESIDLRPYLRADRLCAASYALQVANDSFHNVFDLIFPKAFVLPALKDLSASVRHHGSLAAGAALSVLPDKDRIVTAILNRLPPVSSHQGENQDLSYKKWYQHFDLESGSTEFENEAWDNARVSMEHGAVFCRTVIACAYAESTLQMLYDIIRISSNRPDLEAYCFQACERVALSLGYAEAEELLQDETESIVRMWIENGEPFEEIPFLLSSPKLLRTLLKAGRMGALHYDTAVSSNESNNGKAVFDDLNMKHVAADKFIEAHQGFILPQILLRFCSSKMSGDNSEDVVDARADVGRDPYMQEFAICLKGSKDIETIKNILLSRMHDIHAICAPMAHSRLDKLGRHVMELVSSILQREASDKQLEQERPYLVIRRILELSGREIRSTWSVPIAPESFSEAISSLVEKLKLKKRGDVLSTAGTSYSECFLYARMWLDQATTSQQKKMRWATVSLLFDMIFAQISRKNYNHTQLGLSVNVIIDIILDPKLCCIRGKALLILRDVLEADSSAVVDELAFVWKRLVGSLMKTHEENQKLLIDFCERKAKERFCTLRKSVGLASSIEGAFDDDTADVWGWDRSNGGAGLASDSDQLLQAAIKDFLSIAPCDIVDSITGTYDLLFVVFGGAKELKLGRECLVGCMPPYAVSASDQKVLEAINPRFCAQKISVHYLERVVSGRNSEKQRSPLVITTLLNDLRNRAAWIDSLSSSALRGESKDAGTSSLSMSQFLLKASLNQLEEKFRRDRLNGGLHLPDRELSWLIREICSVCGAQCPDALRLAASRCLGELDSRSIEKASLAQWSDGSNGIEVRQLDVVDLLRNIQARSVKILGEFLFSPLPGVAIAAIETLTVVLATEDGKDCWDLLDDHSKRNLYPVQASKRKNGNTNGTRLLRPQLEAIKLKAGLSKESSQDGFAWCWNRKLWQCRADLNESYEDWICTLVPALIECCFRFKRSARSGLFFSACQRMAAVAPTFASAIFPALMIDLLIGKDDEDTMSPRSGADSVVRDTWIGHGDSALNSTLSSSFEAMLGKSSDREVVQDPRALALALDTLDLLRLATQTRFQQSDLHKKNSNVDYRKGDSRRQSKGSTSSRSSKSLAGSPEGGNKPADYNRGLGKPIKWEGPPFGTVLKVDGALIVKASIRARRFASALFYSDLYFDCALGGSGAIMERLALDFSESCRASEWSRDDISGFYSTSRPCEPSLVRQRAVASLDLLAECYLQLHEDDAYQAVQRQSSDLRYSGLDASLARGGVGRVLVPALADLQMLDSFANISGNTVSLVFQTVESMESLGLRTALQSYVKSLELPLVASLTPSERRMLREKWFESRLYGMSWDTTLFDVEGSLVGAAETAFLNNVSILGETEIPRKEMGFHEAIANALAAFARDELQTCQGLLDVARESLLQPVASIASGESPLEQLSRFLERFQALNDLDTVTAGSINPDDLLEQWGFTSASSSNEMAPSETEKAPQIFPCFSAEFQPCVREAFIRILRYQSNQKPRLERFEPQKCLIYHLREFSRWSRKSNHLDVAECALQRLASAILSIKEEDHAINRLDLVLGQRLEEASLRESKGDFSTAVRLSKQAINLLQYEKTHQRGDKASVDELLVDSLITCGNWLSKYKIEPARVILQSYHSCGAELAQLLLKTKKNQANSRRYLKAQLALGRLASSLFDAVSSRMKSVDWSMAGRSLAQREEENMHCENMIASFKAKHSKLQKDTSLKHNKKRYTSEIARLHAEHHDLVAYQRNLQNEIALVKQERETTEKSLKEYLILTVHSLAAALSIAGVGEGGDMSRHVFRLIFLWLTSCSDGKDDSDVNSIIEDSLYVIPSFRFVPLTNQLFAQLDEKKGSHFQATLHKMTEKMCLDHPYLCLPTLVAVCNGRKVGTGVSGRNAAVFLENVSEAKVGVAAQIVRNIKTKAPAFVGGLLENYELLMSAYIDLANAPTAELVQKGQTRNVGFSAVMKSNRLDRCLSRRSQYFPCVLTSPPQLRPGADYGDGLEDPVGGERVKGFENTFSITESGLHRPKIVVCEGSKGGRFRQLVKGEDEIRQDAVMEQVFTYVNDLMHRGGVDGGSSTRGKAIFQDLRMVTYTIVPLSPASGVLEWVENTATLGDYIIDKGGSKAQNVGSHSRYYPGEWGHHRCRTHFAEAPKAVKREAFDAICSFCSPSFRYFFVERFGHSLKEWYAAKRRYTRSVAVSSIVGHILGIGDRHTNNILVSETTGEVVHIDFGIVFEQGKLLNVPELVPFRLTRNIVDGLGPTGTEGAFSRSAEHTTVVLRENANALLTILSAIASDPLYRWSVSPVEARRRQRGLLDDDNDLRKKLNEGDALLAETDTKTERNKAAEQALAKIHEKLQGYEDGTSGEQQSIEGQVQLLINSARDPDNLSLMYFGWAPWV